MMYTYCSVVLVMVLYVAGTNAKLYFDNDDIDLEFFRPLDSNAVFTYDSGREFKDPFDCRIFYIIIDDNIVVRTCETGKYFHESRRDCFYEKPANCKTSWHSRRRTEEIVPTTTSVPLSTFSSTTTSSPTRQPAVNAVTPEPDIQSFCNDQPDGFTYQRPTNCRSYAVCWRGQSHDGECPKGFSYNGVASVCDISNNYQCESDHFCPPTGIHSFRKIGNCSEYNFCFAGVHLVKRCADGLHFDAKLNRCNVPVAALCYECPVEDDTNGLVTYPGRRCDKYYMCQNAEVVEFECASGLQWNQEQQQCDLADNVNCKNRSSQ